MNKPGKKKTKNVPYFSNEYVIKNHGDIVSFIATIFIVGFMLKWSQPISAKFIIMQHSNASVNGTSSNDIITYRSGGFDFLAIFFYSLFCIVFHAALQEYGLDKLNKRFHLSKTKFAKFNQSGQLVAFYFISAFWIGKLIKDEALYLSGASIMWEGYPHYMTFWIKVFFIIQMAYWVHEFPELYFQKIKRDDYQARITYPALYLLCIAVAYIFNFTRVALVLLFLQYLCELLFHVSRLLYLTGINKAAAIMFPIWKLTFVMARIASVLVTFLVFFRGLPKDGQSTINIKEGNFNTATIRLNIMTLVCLVQMYLSWAFITFHMRRFRDQKMAKLQSAKFTTNADMFKQKSKKMKNRGDDDISDLTEADQNELQQRRKNK